MVEQIIDSLDKEAFVKYLSGLVNASPEWVFITLTSFFLIGTILFLVWKGVKKGLLLSAWLFFFDYILLIICSTVVFRQYSEKKTVELRLFWSFDRAMHGEPYLFYENIMNIVVFVPIGYILCSLLPLSKWWITVIIGMSLSVMIELMQLGFHRGLCELDDVIHNTVGCLVGVLIACLIKVIAKYFAMMPIHKQ